MKRNNQPKKWQLVFVIFALLIIGITISDAFKDGIEKGKNAATVAEDPIDAISVFKEAETNFNDYRGLVSFTLSSNLSSKSAVASYYKDIYNYCKSINELDLKTLEQIHFHGKVILKDKYGNESLETVIKGFINVSDIKAINYSKTDGNSIKEIMETTYIHPALE